ncbi:MAG: tryptophan synthase subunit alpha [Candidatus Limnocylindrales bacterium]
MSAAAPAPAIASPGSGTSGTAGAARIRATFEAAKSDGRTALIAYIVAGYPDGDTSLAAALAAIDGGADVLELGLPYSDPLADGATLQHASSVALRNGATFERSLDLLARIHRARPTVPLVPMAYVNQAVGRDDPEAALRRLAEAGASGLILADLTIDEGAEIEAAARAADLALVYLVAPTTAPDRRIAIAHRSGGYLYAVSFVGVTGARRSLPPGVGAFLRDVRARSPIPVAAGFGVSRPGHVRQLGRVVDGVIVGSALVDALGDEGDVARMADLVRGLAVAAQRDLTPRLPPEV